MVKKQNRKRETEKIWGRGSEILDSFVLRNLFEKMRFE